MKKKKAKLIILHHSGDARILKEVAGSGQHYQLGSEESKYSVVVTQASVESLKKELLQLGLVIDDIPTIKKVAEKFAAELIRRPNGKLAMDNSFGLGLCEIIS